MSYKVLLGMDDGTADIFRQQLMTNSTLLEVLDQNIAIFHNANRAIESLKPDIFLISMNHIRYDSKNIENELLRGIAKLKMNPKTSNVRVAVQADVAPTNPFLRKLALIQVEDIFPGNEQNQAVFNIAQVARQLSSTPNLKNIYKYLALNNPIEKLELGGIESDSASSVFSSPSNSGERVKQLEKIVKILKQENEALVAKSNMDSIPREDYDDLIREYENIMQSGLTEQNFSSLFKKIVKINKSQKEENQRLAEINKRLNNSVIDLNNQIEILENSSPPNHSSELMRLKRENQRLQNMKQAPSNIKPIVQKKKVVKQKPQEKTGSNIGKIIALLLSVLVIGGVGMGVFYNVHKNQSSQVEQQKPSFSSLVKAGNYDQAAMYYPKRAVEAENKMLADSSLSDKSEMANRINKYSGNDAIKFDVAYFKGDYTSAADLYKRSDDANLTQLSDERRVMAAYALMKAGYISDAKTTAKPLHNDKLDQKISVYSKFYNANKILNNKITNDNLSKSELKEAKRQIKENQEAMDKL